jgi:hypothetical protein
VWAAELFLSTLFGEIKETREGEYYKIAGKQHTNTHVRRFFVWGVHNTRKMHFHS